MPTAVITGATKGIGRAIAQKLLTEGFDIAICARTTRDLRNLHFDWERDFPERKIFMQNVDVQDKQQIALFAKNIQDNFSGIDLLVNNAGSFAPGLLSTEPDNQLEFMMSANLYSAYYLSRALIPLFKKQQSGHIFNMCSVAGLKAYPNGGSYSISKYALLAFTENLRYELMADNIKVTAISPGAVWTDSWRGSGVAEERIMKAQDIADLLWTTYQLSAQATVEHIIIRPQLGDL